MAGRYLRGARENDRRRRLFCDGNGAGHQVHALWWRMAPVSERSSICRHMISGTRRDAAMATWPTGPAHRALVVFGRDVTDRPQVVRRWFGRTSETQHETTPGAKTGNNAQSLPIRCGIV